MKAALLTLVLAGCAIAPPVTTTVSVPVPVRCEVERPAEPAWPTAALPRDADVLVIVRAALAEIDMRIAYEQQLWVVIEKCGGKQ